MGDCGVAAVPGHADLLTGRLFSTADAGGWTSNLIAAVDFDYEAHEAGEGWTAPATGDWTPPPNLDNGVDLGDWLLWLFGQSLIEGFVKIKPAQMDAGTCHLRRRGCRGEPLPPGRPAVRGRPAMGHRPRR